MKYNSPKLVVRLSQVTESLILTFIFYERLAASIQKSVDTRSALPIFLLKDNIDELLL